MIEIKAPNSWESVRPLVVFVGGSIEQGNAPDWQKELAAKLKDTRIILLNPRRDNWDKNLRQDCRESAFRHQVVWELAAQEVADICVYYFAPGTMSPISLLELGLFKGKAVVCCPEGFWRKGNVDIVCETYDILQVDTLDELAKELIDSDNRRVV